MKKSLVICLLLVFGWSFLGTSVGAVDVGWMQKGVRVWYFGGVGTGMSSDAEEAYLLGAINGANVPVTHHSALNHWGSPLPVETKTYSRLDQGPCWIHPVALHNLQTGNYWLGQKITVKTPLSYNYNDFLNALPARNHFLPVKALFDLKPQRDLVKITYIIDYFSSASGSAYFDAETGIALYYNAWSPLYGAEFFILSEINYDFARKRAFAEDDGPHTGFKSEALEDSLSPLAQVFIQSMVETRYGNAVALHVLTNLNGGSKSGDESYCFFGDIPILQRIDWTQRTTLPPEQWNPFGEYLFWWLPPTALNRAAINIYNVAMSRTATQPYTFASTQTPQSFYFTSLWLGNDGYMTTFYAKDPTIGLNLNNIYENLNKVKGLDYYRNTMGRARPVVTILPALGPMLVD
jgi:hypothetical protein